MARLAWLLTSPSRDTWVYTVLPVQSHACGLCQVLAENLEDGQKAATQALFAALIELDAPDEDGTLAHGAAWAKVKRVHGGFASAFAGSAEPWTVADLKVSTPVA